MEKDCEIEMKIVYINETCGTGSIGRLILDMMRKLDMQGIETYCLYTKESSIDKNTIRVGNRFDKSIHAILSRITGLQGYFSVLATYKMIKELDVIQPDIIHLHNLHANYINLRMIFRYIKRNNIPIVITLHDCWFFTGKCTYFVAAKCYKWMKSCGQCPLLHIDNVNPTFFFDRTRKCLRDKKKWLYGLEKVAIIGVSKWITEQAQKSILARFSPNVIYNWVDYNVFHLRDTKELRSRLGLKDKYILLMVCSRISNIKGFNVAVSLSERLDDSFQIIIIGKNSDKLLIPSNIIHIEYTNSTEELSQYYSLADICINTTKYETFGMVTAESMCCGTPVIVFDNTASPELVPEGCGYVVNEECGIEGVINAIYDARKLGKDFFVEKCLKNSKTKFDSDYCIGQYVDLYRKML